MTQEIIIRLQRNFMGCLWGDLMLLLGCGQPWTNKGSTTANPMHTYVCYVMYCKPYAKQSPHKLSIRACKKCRVSVWYFLVYTVSADVVVAVVVVVEYNCLFTLRTNLLLTFCCSLLKFRLKIHLILSSFFSVFLDFFLILCFCFSSSSYCV